jgi:hypothetical protein
MSLKDLWNSKTPYEFKGGPLFSKEVRVIKEHGPILLNGATIVLTHNLKWVRKFIKIGIWVCKDQEVITQQREEQKQLPPPKQPHSL